FRCDSDSLEWAAINVHESDWPPRFDFAKRVSWGGRAEAHFGRRGRFYELRRARHADKSDVSGETVRRGGFACLCAGLSGSDGVSPAASKSNRSPNPPTTPPAPKSKLPTPKPPS